MSFDSSMCFLIISQEQEYFKICGLCCELISPVFRFRSFSAKTNDNLFEILEQLQYLTISGKCLAYNKDQIYVFQGPLTKSMEKKSAVKRQMGKWTEKDNQPHCWKLDLNSYDPATKQGSNNFVTNLITKLIISAYLSMCFNTVAF